MDRDVIISAYATPSASVGVDAQPLSAFTEAPLIISVVPGSGTTEAGRYGDAAAKLRDGSGSILKPLLKRALPKGDRARRVALVSFSAGWGFLSAVIKGPDHEWVDAALLVDSLAFPRTYAEGPLYPGPGWTAFLQSAGSAAFRGPLFVSSCVTGIPSLSPLVGSTTASTNLALETAEMGSPLAPAFDFAQLTALAPEKWPITITGGNPASTEVFPAPPMPEIKQAGNAVGLFYAGKGGPAHIFQAWHVQPRLFRTFLAPWWQATPCEQPISGLGDVTQCATNRVAPADVVGQGGGLLPWLAGAGLAAGVGYLTRDWWLPSLRRLTR